MDKSVIALIGPPGSGKSSVGRELARQLNWRFLDTDCEIEHKLGKTVPEIFQILGESEFRKQECLLVEELASTGINNLVLATGGGLPIIDANWQRLETLAIIVYLTAPLKVLVTRINQSQNRPLLAQAGRDAQSTTDKELDLRLGKLIAERTSIYNRARYKIDTSAASVEQLADEIIRLSGSVLGNDSKGKDLSQGLLGKEE